MTETRLPSGYQPDFDIDIERGRQGELFVLRIRDALINNTAEVKTDYRAAETGNLYIEVQCQRRDGWTPSGIVTTKTGVWCHLITPDVCIAAPTEKVRAVARHLWEQPRRRGGETDGSHPTEGVLVPIALFVSLLANGIP